MISKHSFVEKEAQPPTKNIEHLAESTKNEDNSNK